MCTHPGSLPNGETQAQGRDITVARTVKVKDAKTGAMVDGSLVKVVKADEPFSYFTLEDETEITMRTTVSQIIRHIDQWDDGGNPIYTIIASGTMTVTSPNNLMRPSEGENKDG